MNVLVGIASQNAKFSHDQILHWRVNEVKNFVRENVSSCSLCQAENERFGRDSLSKSETVSNRTDLKTNF